MSSIKSGDSENILTPHGKKTIDDAINSLKFDKPKDRKIIIVDSSVDSDVKLITDDNINKKQSEYTSKDKQPMYHDILKKKKIINVLCERFTDIFEGDVPNLIIKDSREGDINCRIEFMKNVGEDIVLKCVFDAILNKIEFVITKKIDGKDKMLYRSIYRLVDTKWVGSKIETGKIIFRPFYKEGETEAGFSTPLCRYYTRFIRGSEPKEVTIRSPTMREQDVRNISRLQALDENEKFKIRTFTELVQRRINDDIELTPEDKLAIGEARDLCHKNLISQHITINPVIDGYITSKLKYLARHANGKLYNSKVEESDSEQAKDASSYTTVSENVIETEYEIKLNYTIPSDGKTHFAAILVKDLKTLYRYKAIPKLNNNVYLTAVLPDWEDAITMSGEASIYYDGSYIGRTSLAPGGTEDTIQLSLGIDKNIAIKRQKIKDKCSQKLLDNDIIHQYTYEITMKNSRATKIEIDVEDQLPLTYDKAVSIDRKELSGGKYDEVTGILKWRSTIQAKDSKKLTIVYQIKAPKTMPVAIN